MPELRFSQRQQIAWETLASPARHVCLFGGARCVSGATIIDGQSKTIAELAVIGDPVWVWTSLGLTLAEAPFLKGKCKLLSIWTEGGKQIEVTPDHRFWDGQSWVYARTLRIGSSVAVRTSEPTHLVSNSAHALSASPLDAQCSKQTLSSWLGHCFYYCRRYGQRLLPEGAGGQEYHALPFDVWGRIHKYLHAFQWRVLSIHTRWFWRHGVGYNRSGQQLYLFSKLGDAPQLNVFGSLAHALLRIYVRFRNSLIGGCRYLLRFGRQQSIGILNHDGLSQSGLFENLYAYPYDIPSSDGYDMDKVSFISSTAEQDFYTLHVPVVEQYFANGFLNHNSGKTWLIVLAILRRALKAPGSRHLIARFHGNSAWKSIAGDANATLFAVARGAFGEWLTLTQHRLDGFFDLPNGSTIWIGGLEDKERVDKILGREYSSIYLNEASEIPFSTASIALTRLAEVKPGIVQRAFIDLNPVGKTHWTNRLFVERIDPINRTPLVNPESFAFAQLNPFDNSHNLDPEYLATLARLPEKQRKRFFEGVFVDEVEGALWSYEIIERCRRELPAPSDLQRVVVAVDPSGAKSTEDMSSDEIGIIVCAKSYDGHGYILADRTIRAAPSEWARRAVAAFHEFKADSIVAEINFGGAMVEATIRTADSKVPVRMVTASRGKVLRAEPISVLYERDLIHHVGRFPDLEDQLCAFSSAGYMGHGSPDRADAAIHGLTNLMLGYEQPEIVIPFVAGRPRHNPW